MWASWLNNRKRTAPKIWRISFCQLSSISTTDSCVYCGNSSSTTDAKIKILTRNKMKICS